MDMNTRILLTVNFKISLTCDAIMVMAVLKIILHTNVIDILNIGADFVENSRQENKNRVLANILEKSIEFFYNQNILLLAFVYIVISYTPIVNIYILFNIMKLIKFLIIYTKENK